MERKRAVLLVSANRLSVPYPVYPLGLSYLKSSLIRTHADIEVILWDMNFHTPEELITHLQHNEYMLVGLSLRNIDDNDIDAQNSYISWYKQLSKIVKENSNAPLVVGGAGYSIFPQLLFSELKADYGIKGEGEKTLVELINAIENNGEIENIEGLIYCNREGVVVTNERLSYASTLYLRLEDELIPPYWNKGGMLNIQTKRGCPHHCIFCSYPVIEGREIRLLNIDEVVKSIVELKTKHNVNYLFFTDSVFNIDRAYNTELAEKIIESGVKINWGAYFSPRNLSKEELLLYKKAGLKHIEFGSDSFSDQQLINYKKGFKWKDILQSSRLCNELGIFYAHFLILGGVGETETSLTETFERSKELTNTVIFPYTGMRIYPETELYQLALKEGLIRSEEELLLPKYYVSTEVDVTTIEHRAKASGAKWIFPTDRSDEIMNLFRARKRKGPLWEYLILNGELR